LEYDAETADAEKPASCGGIQLAADRRSPLVSKGQSHRHRRTHVLGRSSRGDYFPGHSFCSRSRAWAKPVSE
jgi:hypothetical protein